MLAITVDPNKKTLVFMVTVDYDSTKTEISDETKEAIKQKMAEFALLATGLDTAVVSDAQALKDLGKIALHQETPIS